MEDRVLLTGASGFLGHYLVTELSRRGATVLCAGRHPTDRVSLELAEPLGFAAALADAAPDLVINCGAMSSMAACQARPTVALQTNGKSPQLLARVAACRFVQVSTDLVFDGETAPYHASSVPRPLSVYGMSKAAGEDLDVDDWLVVRVPLLIGRSADGRRGGTDMLRRALGAREKLVLFTDEYRTPVHAGDAAAGVVDLALDRSVSGIRHVAGAERLSRWQLCERFCAAAGVDVDEFRPGQSNDPRRPKDVSLVADWLPERDLDAALADC